MDGSVSVFPNGVSKWMAVFRNGWQCFGVSGGVSRKCFEVDGSVSVFPNGVSKWMAVFPDFILSSTTASAIALVPDPVNKSWRVVFCQNCHNFLRKYRHFLIFWQSPAPGRWDIRMFLKTQKTPGITRSR